MTLEPGMAFIDTKGRIVLLLQRGERSGHVFGEIIDPLPRRVRDRNVAYDKNGVEKLREEGSRLIAFFKDLRKPENDRDGRTGMDA